MSDTTTTGEQPTTTNTPAKDAHLEQAMKERDAAKAKAREMENVVAEQRAKLDAVDQEKQEREHELARKAGEFGTIESSYKQQLEAKDKELAEARSKIALRERTDRSNALAEAVARKTGITDIAVIRGVLRLASESGFEDAPAELTDDVVAEATKRVQVDAKSLFTTKSTPPANGGTSGSDHEVPAKYANDPQKRAAYLAGVERSTTPRG